MTREYFDVDGRPAVIEGMTALVWEPDGGGFMLSIPSAVRAEGKRISKEEFEASARALEAAAKANGAK